MPEGAGQLVEPETTLAGVVGGAARGALPYLTGPAIGGAVAGPVGAAAVTGAQMGLEALIPAINQKLGTNIQTPSQAVEALADWLKVAKPQTAVEHGAQAVVGGALQSKQFVEAAKGVAQSAMPLLARAGQIAAEGEKAQIISGAASAATSQLANDLGLPPSAQAVAGLAGGMLGARAARTAIVPGAQAHAAERALVTQAEKAGVPLMTSDVAPPTTFMGKAAQAMGERVPVVGTAKMREAQQVARGEAVRDVLRDFGGATAATASDAVMEDLMKTRGARLRELTTAKNDVITRLASAGDLPVTRTVAAIDQQIAKLQGLKTKELAPVIQRLEDWKQSVQGQNIENVETLRKQLGESFKAPELASVRGTGEKALSSIYGALRDDMSDFIAAKGKPNDLTKWQVTNKELASSVSELKNSALKTALEKGKDTPETIGRLLFSEKPSDIRLLYRNLSDQGRASAKNALIARAVEKATTESGISPDRFLSEIEKQSKQIGVFFKGDDLQRVKGLERVLGATRRAAKAGLMTDTGQQAVPAISALAAGQLTGSAVGGAAALGAGGLMARIYESKPVRNLLLALPATKVGSPEEAALLKRIDEAARAAQKTSPEEQPTP